MKQKNIVSSLSLFVPIADVVCTLEFHTLPNTFLYFKKRFSSIPSTQSPTQKIIIYQSKEEFIFTNKEKKLTWKIPTKDISLESIFFIISAMLQCIVLDEDMLLIHGSSIEKNGEGYIFLGPSGAGKSTITASFSDSQKLSDDITIIKKIKKDFFVFSSSLDNKKKDFVFKKVLLKNIYFIKQASFNKRIQQDKMDSLVSLLFQNLFFVFLETHKKDIPSMYQKKLYSLSMSLVDTISPEILFFRRDFNTQSL